MDNDERRCLEAGRRLGTAANAIREAGVDVPSELATEGRVALAILGLALELSAGPSACTVSDIVLASLPNLADLLLGASKQARGLFFRDGRVEEEDGYAIPPPLFEFVARLSALEADDPPTLLIDLTVEWVDSVADRLERHVEEARWSQKHRDADLGFRERRGRSMRRWERAHPEVLVTAPKAFWRPERRPEVEPYRRLRARHDRAFERANRHALARTDGPPRRSTASVRPRAREQASLRRRAHAPPEPSRPRPGRPPTDPLDVLDRTVDALVADPQLAARPTDLRLAVRAREGDLRRILRALRRLSGVELPAPRLGRPKNPCPNPERGAREG